MRKIIAVVVLTFALLGFQVPAQADAPSRWGFKDCRSVTQGSRTYTHCFDVGWRGQSDGAGVAFEDTGLTTPNGCSNIQDSLLRNVEPRMYRHPEHTLFLTGDWGNDGCNTHHDYAWRGEQVGCTDLRVTMDIYTEGSNYQNYRTYWRAVFCATGQAWVEDWHITILS